MRCVEEGHIAKTPFIRSFVLLVRVWGFRMAELTWLFMLRLTFVLAGADTGVFSISSCLSRAATSVDENRFSEHH